MIITSYSLSINTPESIYHCLQFREYLQVRIFPSPLLSLSLSLSLSPLLSLYRYYVRVVVADQGTSIWHLFRVCVIQLQGKKFPPSHVSLLQSCVSPSSSSSLSLSLSLSLYNVRNSFTSEVSPRVCTSCISLSLSLSLFLPFLSPFMNDIRIVVHVVDHLFRFGTYQVRKFLYLMSLSVTYIPDQKTYSTCLGSLIMTYKVRNFLPLFL